MDAAAMPSRPPSPAPGDAISRREALSPAFLPLATCDRTESVTEIVRSLFLFPFGGLSPLTPKAGTAALPIREGAPLPSRHPSSTRQLRLPKDKKVFMAGVMA